MTQSQLSNLAVRTENAGLALLSVGVSFVVAVAVSVL
jgi:hypothetical protein